MLEEGVGKGKFQIDLGGSKVMDGVDFWGRLAVMGDSFVHVNGNKQIIFLKIKIPLHILLKC